MSETTNTERHFKVARVFAHLLRNEGLDPDALERAVASAQKMRMGEVSTLTGPGEGPRRAFVFEQLRLIWGEQ